MREAEEEERERGWWGRENGTGRLREAHHQLVSRNRGTGHERATVFVNVTTKLSAVPRLTRHSLKFHRGIAPQPRRVTGVGESGKSGFSHFIHCACPTFDNARLARRHESDPLFLSLSLSNKKNQNFDSPIKRELEPKLFNRNFLIKRLSC